MDNALREAEWLAEAARDEAHLKALVERRLRGEPLQYLTGIAGFRYLELRVGPGVLIPRPETEVVTETAIDLLPEGGTVVDVGTGSGAIALAIKYERPDARVIGTEVSPKALEWAQRNRRELGLDVEFLSCDLLDGLAADLIDRVDVVVSNPPYVALEDRDALPVEVRSYEPEVALFAPGHGLGVIGRLAEEAPRFLREGGWLVLEIAPEHASQIASVMAGYAEVEVRRDLTGRERIAVGRRV